MDQAANTFVDELVKISGKNFVDDVKVNDKVCRFTFDIMLTCLLGDSSDIQTRNRFKKSSCVPVIFFSFFFIFLPAIGGHGLNQNFGRGQRSSGNFGLGHGLGHDHTVHISSFGHDFGHGLGHECPPIPDFHKTISIGVKFRKRECSQKCE